MTRDVEQRGLYFDELEMACVYEHRPRRTLSEADNVCSSTLTMNPQALHLDAAWSAEQPFGQRLVNSMMTLAVLVGSSVAQLTQGTIVANLGFTDVAFPHPLLPRRHALRVHGRHGQAALGVAARAGRSSRSSTRDATRTTSSSRRPPGRCCSGAARRGPALLFCPADRPDRYEKAAARADTVILDLEDAVSPDAKAAARQHLAAVPLDPERTIVRVNPAPSSRPTCARWP